ncbi:hypothetical protein ACYBEL_24610 [Klebsiella pneumoniae]|uniref:hypothetical protein n=1 Tax=Klebsiella pneumoniae TaxID=573 RepID=UPI0030EB699D
MTKSTITREQLIKKAQEQIEFCRHTKITGEGRAHVNQCAALFEIALAAMDSEPVAALKLPPKLSNDRERAHELNTGVDIWNRCIDEVAKINGEMIIAGRVDGLHPSTMALVNDFATALAEKLHKAELKYGYSNAWINNGWMTECLAEFHRHIAKGDPRDVAAYCAFMWYHGWKTEAAQPAPVVPVTDAMAYAFHHALTDSPLGDDDVEDIKAGLRAALVNVFNTQPAPQEVHDEK